MSGQTNTKSAIAADAELSPMYVRTGLQHVLPVISAGGCLRSCHYKERCLVNVKEAHVYMTTMQLVSDRCKKFKR